MHILGIETSCDETAAAVVKDGREVLSNIVYSQIPLHQPYGGVVPEVASRAHVEKIGEVLESAMRGFFAAKPGGKIDAVAVTYGAGLSPALLVGLNAAKGLAKSLGVPLIAINHIEAHLHTPFLDNDEFRDPGEAMPALGLAVSGGHTNWIEMEEYGRYRIIGQTLDDAAGEAFDKAAKMLGLGYPGGPVMDKLARGYLEANGTEGLVPFPQGRPRDGVAALSGLNAGLCVSFSGLKTALLRYIAREGGAEKLQDAGEMPRIAASYQEAIVLSIADRTRNALRRRNFRAIILGGGVSLNSRVRETLKKVADEARLPLLTSKPKYCGDNGAMIAGLAYFRRNITGADAMNIDVAPSLEAGEETWQC